MTVVTRILLFGDDLGIPTLLRHISPSSVIGIVAAANRPQYHQSLSRLAATNDVAFSIQPLPTNAQYSVFHQWIVEQDPDLIWVNSYSMIVREDILRLPRLGGINIHGALLPQYRGANPTQWAILNGETETGVTLHEMTVGIDEGRIIAQKVVPLYFDDTWKNVHHRIANATDALITEILPSILSGSWQSKVQEEEHAHYHRRRKPEDGFFRWSQPVIEIYNLIRALVSPLPGAFYINNKGDSILVEEYLSLAAVTKLKYGNVGGAIMASNTVHLRPIEHKNTENLGLNRKKLTVTTAKEIVGLISFSIDDLSTQEVLGVCELLCINSHERNAELQVQMNTSQLQGSEFSSDAIKLLTQFGFKDLNLCRIYLHVPAKNQRAIETYVHCGFQQEGILREAVFTDEEKEDILLMVALASQYA